MKRIISAVLVLASLFLVSCSLEFSAGRTVTEDGVTYYKSAFRDVCFVGACLLEDGDEELVIPDEVDGHKVISLGGTAGSGSNPIPFLIYSENTYYPCSKDDLPEDAVISERTITLRLGKNVETINNFPRGYYNVKDTNEYVHLTVYVTCDGDNSYYYSKDGKLYETEGDELVTFFEYVSEQ